MDDSKKPLLSTTLPPPSSSTPPPPPSTTTTPSSSSSSPAADDAAAAAADDDSSSATAAVAPAAAAAASSTVAAVLVGGAIIAVVVIIYLAIGVIGFSRPSALHVKTRTNPTVDALYFSVSTLATVGYGDAHPGTSLFKVLSVPFTLLGYALLSLLVAVTVPAAALRRRRRHRVVLIAAAAILLPVAAGALVFHFVEEQGWVDSVYMSVISVTTVGYGDEVFKTQPGRVFASVWLIFGTIAVTHAFNFLADKLLDWWTPRTDFVTRPEFAIIVLLEKGMLSASDDLGPIYAKFKALDRRNCGRVRLSSLTQNQHRIFSENNNLQGAGT